MTTEVELYDDAAGEWSPVRFSDWQISNGVSDLVVAPTATIRTDVNVDVAGGQSIRIRIDGTTRFEGTTKSAGEIDRNGRRRVEAEHASFRLFEEMITLDNAGTEADTVLQAALDEASEGANYSLNFVGTGEVLSENYSADNRPVKNVFRDIVDRTDRVWWVDGTTITVDTLGNRGLWQSVSFPGSAGRVERWDEGSVDSIRNDVTVIGTFDERAEGNAQDQASIDEYGRRPETINIKYISNPTEADSYAQELLRPDPITSTNLTLASAIGSAPEQNLSNYEIEVTDESKGVQSRVLPVKKQVIEQGQITLRCGEGAGTSIASVNRRTKSEGDLTSPGEVQPGEITETKIADDAITTPKIRANSITAELIDTLALDADQLTIGDSVPLKFGFSAGTTNMLPSGDNRIGQISSGSMDDVFAAGYFDDLRAMTNLRVAALDADPGPRTDIWESRIDMLDSDGNQRYDMTLISGYPNFFIQDASENSVIEFYESSISNEGTVEADNIIENSPASLDRADASEIKDCGWYDPPEYVDYHRKAADRGAHDHAVDGMPLGALLNYVFEVSKDQQQRIEEQEGRIDELEQRIERLEETKNG